MPAPYVRPVWRRGRMPSGRAIAHFSVGVHQGGFCLVPDPRRLIRPARYFRP